MNRSVPLALLLILSTSAAGAAQDAATSRFDAARLEPLPILPIQHAQSAGTAPEVAPETPRRGSRLGTLLHTVGGALVGGWVGYVGSQVAISDWEKDSNGALSRERSAWVAGGVVVGVLGSRLIGGTASPVPSRGVQVQPPRADRAVISGEEIRQSGVSTAYDLVVTLRKEWLVTRGTNSWQETPRGQGGGMGADAYLSVRPVQAPITIYLDDMRLGGAEDMREVPVELLTEVRFLTSQEATYRFGGGHSHGAIVLMTNP